MDTRLTMARSNAREFVTEVLDENLWWDILEQIVKFLETKNVERVRVEFGYVFDRDKAGKPQPPSQNIRLADLERVIQTGLEEGTIEWNGGSDFLFYPLGTDLAFMLCNDADLHFASADPSLLGELGRKLNSSGINVYDSGKPI